MYCTVVLQSPFQREGHDGPRSHRNYSASPERGMAPPAQVFGMCACWCVLICSLVVVEGHVNDELAH